MPLVLRLLERGLLLSSAMTVQTPVPDGLGRGVITVVPVTSNTERVYPFQVLLSSADTGLNFDLKAQAEQIRSVSVERIGRMIGIVDFEHMARLDYALRLHLALD